MKGIIYLSLVVLIFISCKTAKLASKPSPGISNQKPKIKEFKISSLFKFFRRNKDSPSNILPGIGYFYIDWALVLCQKKTMNFIKYFIPSLVLFCIISCRAPEEFVAPPTINPLEPSSITIRAELDTYSLTDKLRKDLSGDIIDYVSPDINLQLLAEESNTVTEIVERIVRPGYWTTEMKRVRKKVERTVRCLLSPWKWGKCLKKEWVTILVPTTIWVEPIKENVPREVLQLIDKTFGVSGKVRVKGQMQKLNIDFNSTSDGVGFTVTTIVNMNLKVDVKQSFLDDLAGNIKIKGLLNCDNIKVKIESKGAFKLNSDIQLEASHDEAKITFLDACSNLPFASFDYQPMLIPTFEVLDVAISKLIEDKLDETIEESLAEEVNELDLQKELTQLVKDNLKAIPLGKKEKHTWILPTKLESIKLDQLKAKNNNLIFRMNVKIQPEIYYGTDLPDLDFKIPEILLNGDFKDEFKIQSIARLNYKTVSVGLTEDLNNSLKDYYNEDPQIPNLTGNKYFIEKTRLYPNGERLAFEFKLYRVNKKGKKKPVKGKTYITAKLGFANDTVKLIDPDLFIKNTPILNLANFKPLKKYLIKELKKSSSWSVKKQLDELRSDFTTTISDESIVINPKMKLQPKIPIYFNKNTIDLYASFGGTLEISLLSNNNDPNFIDPSFIELTNIEELYYEAEIPEIVHTEVLNSITSENSSNTSVTSTNSFLKFKKFKQNDDFQIKNQDSERQKDALLMRRIPGDTLLLKNQSKTFYYILKKQDFLKFDQ
ncbi:hypothetical protein ABW636_04735 [Aquimarina sp. 2201CG1-2-11]|uniref:hypothetical protein n=1 Tax=Aquimarina discodermiae TaxID=3231043 RepID=UPI003462E715